MVIEWRFIKDCSFKAKRKKCYFALLDSVDYGDDDVPLLQSAGFLLPRARAKCMYAGLVASSAFLAHGNEGKEKGRYSTVLQSPNKTRQNAYNNVCIPAHLREYEDNYKYNRRMFHSRKRLY
jgi:hypothetical protein